MTDTFREGIIVRRPFERLNHEEIKAFDKASKTLLEEFGFLCFNEEAVDIFNKNGCKIERQDEDSFRIKIPSRILDDALSTVPSKIKLGARDPNNTLILDAEVPRIYFGSGSETNIWLDTKIETFISKTDPQREKSFPVFSEKRGSIEKLCMAARLAEEFENLDFFIRPVNIQDADITKDNHDVNKFFASLSNITKHVQAGLTNLEQLENVILLAELIAGGREALKKNPIISFITCATKSPLQMVKDATQKLIDIAKREIPLVISSSPQGGSTAPYREPGMVVQINAEILCGIALSQMVNPGTPVLYGSVPVRARMDNLHDMYGAPEFNQYNIDCIQMARFHKIPCYSTAGVGDMSFPGIQATIEKFFTHIPIAMAGAQYIHYAFGLLDRTNTFCPVQAVLDNMHIGMIKKFLRPPFSSQCDIEKALQEIYKVMDSQQKLFVRFVRKDLKLGNVYLHYPFETKDGEEKIIEKALEHMEQMLSRPQKGLSHDLQTKIYQQVPGLVDRLKHITVHSH